MSMFCYQCEQTAGGKGCTLRGVCGKLPETANRHDELTASLIGLARAAKDKQIAKEDKEVMMEGLFATVTNVNFDTCVSTSLSPLRKNQKEAARRRRKLRGRSF